jgi:hypothetical protein
MMISPHLAGLDGPLDLVGLVEGGVGMDGDLQLAAGRLLDLVGELDDIFGVEVLRGIGGGQIPFGLRERANRRKQSERQGRHLQKTSHNSSRDRGAMGRRGDSPPVRPASQNIVCKRYGSRGWMSMK